MVLFYSTQCSKKHFFKSRFLNVKFYVKPQRWTTLQHNGPLFAEEFEALPAKVQLIYDGKRIKLDPKSEEVCTFFVKMIESEYVKKSVFIENFFKDWRNFMTKNEQAIIKNFEKCDFSLFVKHFEKDKEKKEKNKMKQKQLSKEEKIKYKKKLESEKQKLLDDYSYAWIDGMKQKIGNFRIEPPGLFRGRGDHPKLGCVKLRITAKDVTINISKDSPIPKLSPGQQWKNVVYKNDVDWLATWKENIMGRDKYIFLCRNSKLSQSNDLMKFEKARELKKYVTAIRKKIKLEAKSEIPLEFQRATALHLIDTLALRVGNVKDKDLEADTSGVCSLRVEHFKLEKPHFITLDFLGKDSVRYKNTIKVNKQIYNNFVKLLSNKSSEDRVFDKLLPGKMNQFLSELMPGLTTKVFRTFNASLTLEKKLSTHCDLNYDEAVEAYENANRAVAVLCNHQKAPPKTFDAQLEKLEMKLAETQSEINNITLEQKFVEDKKQGILQERAAKKLEKLESKVEKLKMQMHTKIKNKTMALNTSKDNYCDPRISVAWCKRNNIPIQKIYSKVQLEAFAWALETEENFKW